MVEQQKGHGIMDAIKDGLGFVSQFIVSNIVPPIAEGAEAVMKNIDARIRKIEKRIIRKLTSFLIISLGVLFLVFALLFYLIEYLGWSNAVAFFSIGIIILIIGLLLKIGESGESDK